MSFKLSFDKFEHGSDVAVTPNQNGARCVFSKEGGSLVAHIGENGIPQEELLKSKFMYFDMKLDSDLSICMILNFYRKGHDKPFLHVLCGLLPQVDTRVTFDFKALEGNQLFWEPFPGNLKQVIFGTKLPLEEIDKISITSANHVKDLNAEVGELVLSETMPEYKLDNKILCDKYGQSTIKNLENSVKSDEELAEVMNKYLNAEIDADKFRYSEYGGWLDKKVDDGTGYFRTHNDGKRWWLVDPKGYAFISTGLDCIDLHSQGSVNNKENYFEKLEDENGEYNEAWSERKGVKFYDFSIANLIRVYGKDWRKSWEEMTYKRLKNWGINTAAAWSNYDFARRHKVPYTLTLNTVSEFPTTSKTMFRDFPDVLSDEYKQNSLIYAESLKAYLDDEYMIGYFMRNEPEWAFVDNVCIAEQMLANEEKFASKVALVEYLTEKYETVENLNKSWITNFKSFEDLYTPIFRACTLGENTERDLRKFSETLIKAYVELPSKACKAVDPNHLNLGMRYAFISDPSLIVGWENFDVFSINCYQMSPYKDIEEVSKYINIPVMIGEYHFGSHDSGMYATGLKGVSTQKERGVAFKYYMSEMLKHPLGVGAHYFTMFDQALLGRFDGENYQIGCVDITQKPYDDFVDGIIEFNQNMYEIANGDKPLYTTMADEVPKIAY